jgi:hypothetical protein
MAELVIELLKLTYRETDNVKRKQAEESLGKLAGDFAEFSKHLLSVLTISDDEALSMSAVTCLATALTRHRVTEDTARQVAELVTIHIHSAGSRAVKLKLADCLFSLLEYGGFALLRQAASSAVSGFSSLSHETLGCCYMLAPILLRALEQPGLVASVLEMLQKVLQVALNLTRCLDNSDSLEVGLAVVKEVCFTLSRIVTKLKVQSSPLLPYLMQTSPQYQPPSGNSTVLPPNYPVYPQVPFSQSTPLVEFLSSVVSLRLAAVPLDLLRLPRSKLEVLLVESKNLGLSVLSDVVSYLPEYPSPSSALVQQLIGTCASSVQQIVEQIDLEVLFSETILSLFVCNVFKFLASCTKLPLFHSDFEGQFKGLLVYGVLPLLQADEAELYNFSDAPEAFLASFSTLEDEGDHPKLWGTRFLQDACAHLDGVLTFTVKFAAQCFRRALQSDDCLNYSALQAYANSRFIALSPSTSAETCLTVLNSVADLLEGREDLQELHDMMLGDVDLRQLGDLIKARLCVYIKVHSKWLFKDEDDKFFEAVGMTLQALDSLNQSVASSAAACLHGLLVNKDSFERLEGIIVDILQTLIQQATKTQVVAVLDALQELTLMYSEDLDEYLRPMLQALVCRIFQEQALHPQTETIFMVKSWNILRSLADDYMKPKLDLIEEVLQPLIRCIAEPSKVSFDEDIVLLVTTLITSRESVSPLCWEVLPCLKAVQEKYSGAFFHLLGALTAFISYGTEVLRSRPEYLAMICEMSIACLFYKRKGRFYEFVNNEGCLVLHLLVQAFPSASVLPYIFQQVFVRYQQGVAQQFMRQRLLGVIALGFTFNAALTMQHLARPEENVLGYFLEEIVKHSKHLTHTYERKVGVLGICSLLMQPSLHTEVTSRFSRLLEAAINICGWQPKAKQPRVEGTGSAELRKLKKLKERRMRAEEKDVCVLLDEFPTPIKGLDELQVLKTMLRTAFEASPDTFKTLIMSLSEASRAQVELLVQSKVVTLESKTDVRKVVKARRYPL